MKAFLTISLLTFGFSAFAQKNEQINKAKIFTDYSQHCLPFDDDEVHAEFPSVLNKKSAVELEQILDLEIQKSRDDSNPDAPFECSKNGKPAATEYQETFLSLLPEWNQAVESSVSCEGDEGCADVSESESSDSEGEEEPNEQEESASEVVVEDESFELAKEKASKCHISESEFIAIYDYTGSGFGLLNSVLRGKSKDSLACMKMASYIETLNGGLSKIAPYKGYIRRNSELPEEIIARYQVGQVVRERAFVSASVRSFFGGNTAYIILSKNCANVDPLSSNMGEKEVLCPAGSEFLVLAKKKDAQNRTLILMEQIK